MIDIEILELLSEVCKRRAVITTGKKKRQYARLRTVIGLLIDEQMLICAKYDEVIQKAHELNMLDNIEITENGLEIDY